MGRATRQRVHFHDIQSHLTPSIRFTFVWYVDVVPLASFLLLIQFVYCSNDLFDMRRDTFALLLSAPLTALPHDHTPRHLRAHGTPEILLG